VRHSDVPFDPKLGHCPVCGCPNNTDVPVHTYTCRAIRELQRVVAKQAGELAEQDSKLEKIRAYLKRSKP
jgi:hypothetical protein